MIMGRHPIPASTSIVLPIKIQLQRYIKIAIIYQLLSTLNIPMQLNNSKATEFEGAKKKFMSLYYN